MNDRFVEDLKNRLDILQIIGKYTALKKSGKNHMGKSPFRNERTASFCVSPDKQMWYDFGSSEGGDVISFIEKIENMGFGEAVEYLADMVGMTVPKGRGQESPLSGARSQKKKEKEDVYGVHEKANAYFVEQLQKEKKAKDYVEGRGFNAQVAQDWGLGYGGKIKDGLSKYLLKQGFSEKLISESGVAFQREFGDKSIQDRFWGRVMIPIREPRKGEIIAFSGRDILDRPKVGKYINSPENPVYHKSSTLFGLWEAKKEIREKDMVILVEGNFDVVAMHSHGFTHTIATCGTALTEDHLRMIKRFTSRLMLAFDRDLAGKKATLRAMDMILRMDLHPFMLDFEGAKDIDEFLQQGKDHVDFLKKQLQKPQNALDFLLEKLVAKWLPSGIEGRKKILQQMFAFLVVCPRPVEVDYFLGELARHFKTTPSVLAAEFQKYKEQYKSRVPSSLKPKDTPRKTISREEYFVGFLCSHWEDFPATPSLPHLEDVLSGEPERLLREHLEGKITPEDHLVLQSWVLYYEQDAAQETPPAGMVLEEQLEALKGEIKNVQTKEKRLKEARQLGEKLRR